MKVTINDPEQLLSHVLYCNTDLATTIADTEQWKKEGLIEATLCFNGKEVSAQVLEDALSRFVEIIEDDVKNKYDTDNIEKHIEDRARQLLREHADDALTHLGSLMHKLEDCDELLKPHWER